MSAAPHRGPTVDVVRLGLGIRALRRRRGWRQADLAAASGVSQELISLIERGHGDRVAFRTIIEVAKALDARVGVQLRWRAGDLDRLLDAGHALMTAAMVERLLGDGWEARVEITYSTPRAAGSIDILAWHPGTRSLLVIEIKTEVSSSEATLRKLDEKGRLAAALAAERLGWQAASVSRLLVIEDGPTNRRRMRSAIALFDAALPTGGREASAWLRRPSGAISGRLFLSPSNRSGGRHARGGRQRIRRPARRPRRPQSRTGGGRSTDDEGEAGPGPTILVGYHHRGY